MNIEKFDRVYNLGVSLCACINDDQSLIEFKFANTDIEFRLQKGITISLGERKNIANKLVTFNYMRKDDNSNYYRSVEFFKYRKPPKNTTDYPKQRPSLENMFQIILVQDLRLSHAEIDKMEDVLDLYEGKIQILVSF